MNWKAIRIFPNCGPLTIFLSLCGLRKVWVWHTKSMKHTVLLVMTSYIEGWLFPASAWCAKAWIFFFNCQMHLACHMRPAGHMLETPVLLLVSMTSYIERWLFPASAWCAKARNFFQLSIFWLCAPKKKKMENFFPASLQNSIRDQILKKKENLLKLCIS